MTARRADFPACVSPKAENRKLMVLGYSSYGKVEHRGNCGDYFYGETVTCGHCEEFHRAKYPQGWSYYPGDTCPHGTYVGGCGIDWMCGACEGGY